MHQTAAGLEFNAAIVTSVASYGTILLIWIFSILFLTI